MPLRTHRRRRELRGFERVWLALMIRSAQAPGSPLADRRAAAAPAWLAGKRALPFGDCHGAQRWRTRLSSTCARGHIPRTRKTGGLVDARQRRPGGRCTDLRRLPSPATKGRRSPCHVSRSGEEQDLRRTGQAEHRLPVHESKQIRHAARGRRSSPRRGIVAACSPLRLSMTLMGSPPGHEACAGLSDSRGSRRSRYSEWWSELSPRPRWSGNQPAGSSLRSNCATIGVQYARARPRIARAFPTRAGCRSSPARPEGSGKRLQRTRPPGRL